MAAEDLQDRGRGDIDVVVPLEVKTHPHGAVAALLPDAKDESDHLGRNAVADHIRSLGPITQVLDTALVETPLPNVELRAGDAKEPAGPADIPADALRMLQHAQPGLDLPSLLLLVNRTLLHPEPPGRGREDTPPVRDP